MTTFDITLIGGGIVGAATALELATRFPGARVLLLEKEKKVAFHQTGHNSGVVHAGVYYAPGSLKADFCKRGAEATIALCKALNLPFRQCGKLLVATTPLEMQRMEALEDRCRINGIDTRRIGRRGLSTMEPAVSGLGALHVPATGITDYTRITAAMTGRFTARGGILALGYEVRRLCEHADGVVINPGPDEIETRYLIACAGLNADRIARMAGIATGFRIIPFRGEYYRLPASRRRIVSHLIYPVPDPALPFLGVHLTPMIQGCVTVGPNAVLGFKREGYGPVNFSLRDTLGMMAFPGFFKVAAAHAASGLGEFRDSVYKKGYLTRIRKYCPSLTLGDLTPYPAGIRAQAVRRDGTLVHDFLFASTPRSFHVCNAPSPAATSAMPIAEYLCDRAAEHFSL